MKAIQSIKKGLAMVLAAALAIGSLSMPADVANAADDVPTTQVNLTVGQTKELSVEVSSDDATPDVSKEQIAWTSSDPETVVVTADNGGQGTTKKAIIGALKAGTGITITAKKGQTEIAKWVVTVTAATTVTISPSKITLVAGGQAQTLTATVTPTDKRVAWSVSGNDKVIVTPGDGNATTATIAALEGATGTATITATADGVSATCNVIIREKDTVKYVENVTVTPKTQQLAVGAKCNLTAIVSPSDADNGEVSWSTNAPGVATVSSGGEVEAIAVGTAKIKATAGGKSDFCTVTVTGSQTVPVAGVTVTPSTLSLKVNETSATPLTATVTPTDATDKNVTWSTTNAAVATIDSATKLVKAVGVGTAEITATAGDKTGKCVVTVTAAGTTNVPVTGVSLNAKTLVVGKNATRNLKATVAPPNASNKGVTWRSSATAIATVDTKGNVKGIKKGTATITATTADGNKTATCAVTVTEVTLNKTALTLGFGQSSIELKATLSNAKVDRLTSWKTSNATIVRVDARTGKLTAGNKAGTANITVTTQAGATAVCAVTVKEPAVKSVTLGVKKLTMGVKESYKLNATVNPANAGNKKVTWTSDKPKVVKVQNGKLTALKAGKAKITVTSQADKSKKATITVTVKKTPDKKAKVTLNKKKVNLKVKKTFQIKAKISSKYGCASFKYTVDKKGKKVVKVDKNGKVTAKKKGKATITVKPYNGKGKSAKLQITVK